MKDRKCTVIGPKTPAIRRIWVEQNLLRNRDHQRWRSPMQHHKRDARVAIRHHRLALAAVLYLSGALLVLNAWLVSQNSAGF
jgi:hypothetical protein